MNWLIPLTISCAIVLCNTQVPNPEDVYSSLAFVFDTTGSMIDDYVQLKNHAEGIMKYVQKRNDTGIKHFVFVPFNDPDVGPVSETFDPKVIMYKLNKVKIRGGGDCPEMSITAVIQALKVVKPNSYIYVFTDASPKDSHLINEALELIQRKQSQVVVLRTGENCLSSDKSYETIASLGSGNVFDVNKKDVSKVLDFVKTSMNTNRVNLWSVNISQKQTIPYPKKLNIEESIKSLFVSVSGLNPNIEVLNPYGKKMDEVNGTMTNLDLENLKIVKILEPIPGEWTIFVTSESAHSIRACGVSYNKNFEVGFATRKPKNMTQTSHRPLKGTKNYVLVDCPDVQEFLSCSIQDLSSDGKTMSLPILNYRKNMLLCGPFIPSDNPFYVQVFGVNNNGNTFKRITTTSTIPDEQEKPYITTPKKIIATVGGQLHIKCRVESLVPFCVTWKGSNYSQSSWNFSQSSEIELVINNVTAHHEGIYACVAENVAGNSESTTNVTVMAKPTIDGNENETIILYEGGDYSLTCVGHGMPVPKMSWYMNNSPISHYNEHILIMNDVLRLIIYDATLNDSNVYTCRASNVAGITEKHYNVIVKVNTTTSTANEMLVIDELDDAYLHCPLTNMNNQWFKDGVNISELNHKRSDEPHFKYDNGGLKIYNLDTSDNGIYKCMNSTETYSFDLQVAFVPYFVRNQPESMMIRRNETVVFDCMAKGYPTPKVLWKKIDSQLPITQWTLKNIMFLEDKHKLKIHSIDWIHNGTYSCIIKNKMGIEKRHFDLLVF